MKANVVYEPTLQVLGECDDVFEAEDLIGVFEQVDPEGVHAGNYGIDPDEEAHDAYQLERTRRETQDR